MMEAHEDNFRVLAENANVGMLIAAGDGHHVFANTRAAEITGYRLRKSVVFPHRRGPKIRQLLFFGMSIQRSNMVSK